ncbi:MAG: hypothetical protein P0Y59_02685 [Candidatus Sphingomonas phytovorans]|nr:hypothetical protein [Sphingomonas sp.]WEK00618.1 MAG: hypothetical protein P0Y59_02685 [Sphingomonas sp.]
MTIHVTDHALLRYLDLFENINVELTRRMLEGLFARAQGAVDLIGGGDYIIRHDGYEFIVRAGRIATVLPPLSASARFNALAPRG